MINIKKENYLCIDSNNNKFDIFFGFQQLKKKSINNEIR